MCLNYMFMQHPDMQSRGLTRGVKASVPYIETSDTFSKILQFFRMTITN
jgi:hypothetical protein